MEFWRYDIARRGSQIYIILVLLAAILLSPLPQSAIATGLLLLALFLYSRKLHARWEIPIMLGYFFTIPLLFEPTLHLLSPLVAIAILPLIGSSFKENSLNQSIVSPTKQRELTFTSKSVIAATGAIILTSILLGNWVLTITCGIALLFIAGMLIYVLRSLPLSPLEAQQKEIRLIAGNTSKLAIKLIGKAKCPFHISVNSSYPWIYPVKDILLNFTSEAELNLTITPSLSGPSEPHIEVLSTDIWGLIQMRQVIEPVRLYVIPRAKYAEWLARKYLEGTASEAGALAASFSPVAAGTTPKGGVEYCDSRLYQLGDRLKDIDWKHTAKLRKLVIKEYAQEARQLAIIAANLVASDAEEADKLVYNFITSALTLAKETIPTAIAAYDQEQVLAATPLLDPRGLVKEALKLGQKVVLSTPLQRYIQPPDIRQIKISLRHLEKAYTEPAKKLREILELERKIIEEGVKKHPAREALSRGAVHVLPSATITVISPWSYDYEALSLTLEELKRQGYNATVIKIN